MIGKKIPSILSEVDKWAANGVKFIYPVIVYLDDSFDVEDPSYLLNKEFQRIIGEKKETHSILLFCGCNKGCKSHNLLIYTLVCGERGTWTSIQNH